MPDVIRAADNFFPGAQRVAQTPIEGLFEIVTATDVFYGSANGYTFYGDLRAPDGHSLTSESLATVTEARISRLPLEHAIKIGVGPIKIVEFVNPSCPHCRNLHSYLSVIPDITRYVFITGHSNGVAGAELTSGFKEPDKKVLAIHRAAFRAMGVKAVPSLWIGSKHVVGTDIETIEQELELIRRNLM